MLTRTSNSMWLLLALVEKLIEDIVESLTPYREPKKTDKLKMPLMDRDVAVPVGTISGNVNNNLMSSTAKADYYFLFSGGAPGIGIDQLILILQISILCTSS